MKRLSFVLLVFALGAGAGWWFASRRAGLEPASRPLASAPQIWTCSMHPQVRATKPGKCPICSMDLIPAMGPSTMASPEGSRVITLSEAARRLAEIETAPVERRFATAEIRLVGKVDLDASRTRSISARFPARIDRLYVDITGIEIQAGNHLARVYSPELLTAQEELLAMLRFGSNVEVARDKLRLWGLSDAQIRAVERRGTPSDKHDLNAPMSGTVLKRHVNEGDYVKTGQPLLTLTDLDSVWIRLQANESDTPWLRYGQALRFEADAIPGLGFEGRIAFISPTLNETTRTVDVRVNVDNQDRRLKPGMLVHGVVEARLAKAGQVMAPDLRGRWVSPMHPEVVQDKPGDCPRCGMALVEASTLGYIMPDEAAEPPLVVPATAVLRTGPRAVVYVALPGSSPPRYEGREIQLGPRAGDVYLVEDGLREGELVVVRGNFKLDAAMQILARPSMMSAPVPAPVFDPSIVLPVYFVIQSALADDDPVVAGQTAAALEAVESPDISRAAGALARAPDVDAMRVAFEPLSLLVRKGLAAAPPEPDLGPVFELHCPMAFENRGASWLQADKAVRNPYFGAAMLRCGGVRGTLNEASPHKGHEGHEHK